MAWRKVERERERENMRGLRWIFQFIRMIVFFVIT